MARPALAADRALMVLDVLTRHPTRRFVLTELVDMTGVNASSMHALLAVLEQRGWVDRHPTHRTYGLGPVPVATGAVAAQQQPALSAAREQLDGLSTRLGAEAVLTVRVGDEMIVIDRAGETTPVGPPLYPGQRIPLAPPLGTVYVAWADDAQVARWLSRARPRLSELEADEQRRLLQEVRDRGYAVALDSPAYRRFSDAVTGDASSEAALADLLRALAESPYNVASPESDHVLDVAIIAAPVFDDLGRVAAVITAAGLPPGQTAAAVHAAAHEVLGAAMIATKRARGDVPQPAHDRR